MGMSVEEAVREAYADNRKWQRNHRGIVDFILSECSLNNVGNDEYDNKILSFPSQSRIIADRLDRPEGRAFRVNLVVVVPPNAWASAYGENSLLDEAGVEEYLQNALFVGSDQLFVAVNSIEKE